MRNLSPTFNTPHPFLLNTQHPSTTSISNFLSAQKQTNTFSRIIDVFQVNLRITFLINWLINSLCDVWNVNMKLMWTEVKNDRDSEKLCAATVKTKLSFSAKAIGDYPSTCRECMPSMEAVYKVCGTTSLWATPVYAAIGLSTSCGEEWRYNITKSVKNNQKCLLQPLCTFFQAVLLWLLLLTFFFFFYIFLIYF